MKTAIPYLKRFAEWVIDLTDRYRYNLFTKTTVHIILLQVILSLVTIIVFWWAIGYAQQNLIASISSHINDVMLGRATITGDLPKSIEDVRQETLWYVFAGLVALTGFFGIILARFTLKPARESLQFQKRFIGNVAHEIRTPLAIVKTSTEVALMDPSLTPSMRDTLNQTITELNRMSETINNLLSFNTLLRPGRIKPTPVDLGAIVDAVVERHRSFAASRGIKIVVDKGEHPRVWGTATALDQIVTNLVKNAINYTPKDKNGVVTVAIGEDLHGAVTLTVTDTGIGIAQKDLYHIFEPFYRGDTSRARGIGTGTSGLGLAIVNELVRLHRGSITIRSALGEGTSFKITLPKAPMRYIDTSRNDNSPGVHEVSVDFS